MLAIEAEPPGADEAFVAERYMNQPRDGFFGRLKTEMFYNRSWQGVSIDEFMTIVDNYLHWYNEKRIKMSLGAKSPMEYRRSLGLAV